MPRYVVRVERSLVVTQDQYVVVEAASERDAVEAAAWMVSSDKWLDSYKSAGPFKIANVEKT